eukprot:scaffold5454_cov176-Amphora_coffeaeformis.AAC.1
MAFAGQRLGITNLCAFEFVKVEWSWCAEPLPHQLLDFNVKTTAPYTFFAVVWRRRRICGIEHYRFLVLKTGGEN